MSSTESISINCRDMQISKEKSYSRIPVYSRPNTKRVSEKSELIQEKMEHELSVFPYGNFAVRIMFMKEK